MRTVLSERAAAPRAAHTDGAWPLAEPFLIGDLRLENRVVQAPLAGIANWAFRRQSRRHGAGLAVSEMVASLGVRHGNRRTVGMLATAPDEHPVGIQLFGTDPDAMAEAACAAVDAGADMVDVNMGCPVPKVCKTGAGAALLDDLDRAERIVAAMVRAVPVPVTVKMRRGTTPATADPVGAARRFEDAGAAALFVHPRAASEEYAGRADHRVTAEVADAVAVPVIASGDIRSAEEARQVVDRHGAAAVAIGRAALGNPWAFGEIAAGRPAPERTLADVVAEIATFAGDARAALGDQRACAYLRKFYGWYFPGQRVAAGDRDALLIAPTIDEALERLAALAARDATQLQPSPGLVQHPVPHTAALPCS
ncbi:MAG TPA: tRNA-dihydrouridine synthase [Miltoncostaeaceae bacterium]|nr:tRNA-dihydrouridine synthase [Miltoncostaeaceae bacterium]